MVGDALAVGRDAAVGEARNDGGDVGDDRAARVVVREVGVAEFADRVAERSFEVERIQRNRFLGDGHD